MVKNMEKIKYQELINKHLPKENKLKNSLMAFLVGGLIGLFGQILVTIYLNIPSCSNKKWFSVATFTTNAESHSD